MLVLHEDCVEAIEQLYGEVLARQGCRKGSRTHLFVQQSRITERASPLFASVPCREVVAFIFASRSRTRGVPERP
jgi:hypothetical protein